MLNTWKPRLIGASLVGVLAAVGCFNFDEAKQRCETTGNCVKPDGGVACQFQGDDDEPDDEFRDRNCDGVDGMADGGIFVDPIRGRAGGAGTSEDPLLTLGEALERTKAPNAPKRVYLAQGAYNEPGLTIDSQISLYGAYGGRDNNWDRSNSFTSFLDGGPIGLVIKDITPSSPAVLDHLTVRSDNATAPGTASIALQVINSQDIRLRYSTFIAGLGAQGTLGANGSQGLDGGVGNPGGDGGVANAGSYGAGGLTLCDGVNVSGGDGNNGAQGGNSSAGFAGLKGNPTALGGEGGAGGAAGSTNTSPPLIVCTAGTGGPGLPGQPGNAGTPGSSGSGMGELLGTQWVANQQGGSGDPGTPGSGGGGGGSGGSCKRESAPIVEGASGGGSGGGGGGGCGGGAGGGGGGGGASIAVLLVQSNVSFEGDSTLITRGGGRGGKGGEGGPGGGGGPGGIGGARGINTSATYNSYGGDGGPGGPGGHGGPGGPGGGGGGGPSVGIWCGPNAAYTGSATMVLGDGGVGGAPGTGGNAGQPGQQLNSPGCP
ncbi:hypothetical protein [Hyalangium minutum]|uniref:PE-PGRS family protein n=1 Tax=Hyalangium minutum TaxID=394096 RepID=A0A085WTV7_9BACT|nr:hypothetical protein [Hyalangium minutum]KFE71120.1 PE-PGRS family protein [Hyalangium minutum]